MSDYLNSIAVYVIIFISIGLVGNAMHPDRFPKQEKRKPFLTRMVVIFAISAIPFFRAFLVLITVVLWLILTDQQYKDLVEYSERNKK